MNNCKPLVIPIFIPHSGCPHQCAFCNQSIITEKSKRYIIPSAEEIQQVVEDFLSYKGSREEVELAFFGGNFLGLKPDEIIFLLSYAQKLVNQGKIDSVRFSTRPDTITKERLELIAPYPVSTIEIGVQSMNNQVLKAAMRGHTAEDTIKAISLLKQFTTANRKQFTIGMQMMVGLPSKYDSGKEDTVEYKSKVEFTDLFDIAKFKDDIETAQKITELKPDFVRIYPLIVLEGSLIARWYREGKYEPMELDACVKLVKEIFLLFQEHNIPVIRMGLQASDMLQDKLSMVAGPWHPAFGHLVYSEIFFDKAIDLISKSFKMETHRTTESNLPLTITLTVHNSSISRLRGDKNDNIKRLKEIYPSLEIKIKGDNRLEKDEI
ncbi:MAG: radical SAM protein, partial [Desulfamplus sp.]|nr:radical SAM protein [Desulfamplus sp.]